jgi:O-antigen/teichoic acid export membrane protein
MCGLLLKLKRLLGDSVLYSLMSVGTKMIAIIMVPIFLDYLGGSQYGVLANMESLLAIISLLIVFGTDAALAYYYFRETGRLDRQLTYIQNVMGFRLTVATLFLITALLFGNSLSYVFTRVPHQYEMTLWLVMFINLADSIIVLAVTVYRYEMKTIRVVILNLAKLSLYALLSYVFMVNWNNSVESIMWGRLVSIIFILLVCGRSLISFLHIKFEPAIWKEILRYAVPLVPASLAFWLIGSSNRLIITYLATGTSEFALTQVAIFDLAYKFASIISLMTYGMQMAWRPFSMQMKDHKDSASFFGKIYLVIFVIGMISTMTITTLSPLTSLLFGDANKQVSEEAVQYIGFLSLASFINFFYLVLCSGLFFQEDTRIVTKAFLLASILYIMLTFGLYPLFNLWSAGIWAIVIANLITYLVPLLIIFAKSQQVYYVPVPYKKLIFLFVQTVISMATITWLQKGDGTGYYQVLAWMYFSGSLWICRIDRDLQVVGRKVMQEEGK